MLVTTDLLASGLGWALVGPIVLDGSGRLHMLGGLVVATLLTPLVMAGLGLHRSVICVSRPAEVVSSPGMTRGWRVGDGPVQTAVGGG